MENSRIYIDFPSAIVYILTLNTNEYLKENLSRVE